ncbi:transposase [Burkholderia sp. Ac-20365]|uniref:IS110 family transposase n=1 Tax=Burkholderia sp. Ac-20365 TaxID=2703897 RepID=UPI001F11DE9C|nr:transposase [Burkholderia sp. Ac-20365]MBN3760727.1 IS110 family transposase [Burkholderia sp. Ac-20365]
MKYCGIDLHSNNSVVSVIDESDHVVAERRFPNELVKIVTFVAGWKEELAGVVVESTYNWYWLVDGLQAAGFTVHLAHTTAIKKYEGLKHSGDETDARYLAHLLRLGILPTGTILPPEARNLRDLARKRMQLVRSRTTHILAVENITARRFGRRITSNQVGRLDEAAVSQMGLPDDAVFAVQANVATITTLGAQIAIIEKRLQERVAKNPDHALLATVPGIGQTLATVILLEVGFIGRFANPGSSASWT